MQPITSKDDVRVLRLWWPLKCVCTEHQPYNDPGAKETALKTAPTGISGFQEILELTEAELVHVLRNREGIAIEKSADQMDEIQYATERELAIRNVDRESTLLRQVKAALQRIQDGGFGTCLDCEEPISPKRLAAVPWATRCIQCQETSDRAALEGTDASEALDHAA